MQGCTIPLIFKHFFTTGLTLSLLYCTVLFYPKAKNVYSAEPVRLPWARKKVARCLPDSQYFVLITLNANTVFGRHMPLGISKNRLYSDLSF